MLEQERIDYALYVNVLQSEIEKRFKYYEVYLHNDDCA